jgi:protein-S-isoprenylcysteine O-methyltransferase Ste14
MAIAVLMWVTARFTPHIALPNLLRFGVATVVACAALSTALAALLAFRRAKTTPNPTRPSNASTLVIVGVFRFTRNPMYLGLALLLTAWTILLCAPVALLGPVLLVLYLTRFQIIPEERAMAEKFGEDYARYRARVRRWV